MKKKSVVLLAAVLASVSCLCAAEERIHNAESGYSLTIPDGWSVQRDFLGADVIATLETGGIPLMANVVIEPLPAGISLEEYFAASLELVGLLLPGYEEHDRGRETLNGVPALWLIYSWDMNGSRRTNLAYFVAQAGMGYVLTLTAAANDFDAALPIFRSIAASFRFDAAPEESRPEIHIPRAHPEESNKPRPRPAVPAVTAGTFSVAVEQGGRRVEIVDHEVILRKAPFALIVTFSGPDTIMVNASQYPASFELAATGRPLNELPCFNALFFSPYIEGAFNEDKVLLLSKTAPQYWFYNTPTFHRFDGVENVNGKLACRRTIAALYLEEERRTVPIEKFQGDTLYFVFVKAARPRVTMPDYEFHRECIKISFVE